MRDVHRLPTHAIGLRLAAVEADARSSISSRPHGFGTRRRTRSRGSRHSLGRCRGIVSRDRRRSRPVAAGKSAYETALEVLLTGFTILVPVVITVYLINMTLDLVTDALTPVIALLRWLDVIGWFARSEFGVLLVELGVYSDVVDFFTELVTVIVLLSVVVIVGTVGHNRYGEIVIDYVDLVIGSIPGVGTVYGSFRRMSDAMLDQEADDFKEVRLVECLGDDLYVIGFETGPSPSSVHDSTGNEEMVTMFLPMAPNPVTGGFLTHVPRSRVYDVDMTVEEGIRSILTSGVATGDSDDDRPELSMDDIGDVADIDTIRSAMRSDEPGADDTLDHEADRK